MVFQFEMVLIGNFQLNLFNLWHNKFFDSTAIHADQMVVVFSGRDIFVVFHRLAEIVLRELAGFHHQRYNSIDGGTGDLPFAVLQSFRQRVYGEVGSQFEHLLCHQQPLICDLQVPLLQKIGKIG